MMNWTKVCTMCKKEFTSKDFIGNCCSKSCEEKRIEDWESKKQTQYMKLRFEILKRDNFTCQYCGRTPAEDGVKIEIDHKHPKSKGGKDTKSNFITACRDCNIGKFDYLLNKHQKLKGGEKWKLKQTK